MTPDEMQIATAEALGWTQVQRRNERDIIGIPPANKPRQLLAFIVGSNEWCFVPNYPEDLNAMHDAESTLTQKEQESFVHTLVGINTDDVEVEYGPLNLTQVDVLWICSHSTAFQRDETFLRVKGRYNDL